MYAQQNLHCNAKRGKETHSAGGHFVRAGEELPDLKSADAAAKNAKSPEDRAAAERRRQLAVWVMSDEGVDASRRWAALGAITNTPLPPKSRSGLQALNAQLARRAADLETKNAELEAKLAAKKN